MSCDKENKILICNSCNYKTINKKDYNKHKLTNKHIKKLSQTLNKTIIKCDSDIKKEYICECGKRYPYNSSLYNHKKKCVNQQIIVTKNDIDYEKMITTLIDENKELEKY